MTLSLHFYCRRTITLCFSEPDAVGKISGIKQLLYSRLSTVFYAGHRFDTNRLVRQVMKAEPV